MVKLSLPTGAATAELVRRAQLGGVTIHDPSTTWIHADVTIGADTEILPGTQLQAGTTIGSGCSIGPDTTLIACTVEDGASVVRSHCLSSVIGADASVGPFSYLRPDNVLMAGSKVGACVEVKKSTDRPRLEGPAPFLYRGHHHRLRREHRSGHDHRQLRRRPPNGSPRAERARLSSPAPWPSRRRTSSSN